MAQPLYGGQAVLEGVMMRGRRHMAVAVRHPNGKIITRTEALPRTLYASRIARIPFVRGVVMLWDALVLGTRALSFSAHVAMAEPTDEGEATELPSSAAVRVTMLVSLALGIGLFFVLPVLVAGRFHQVTENAVITNLLEGLVRLALLIGYLWLIGRLPEIARVFAYHGAEHKVVHAQERGVRLEPRCGTTLLLVVVSLSIVLFTFLGHPPLPLRIASRLVLIPLLVALSYEWLRFSAAHFHHGLVRALVWPGLLLQSLTTREPDTEQVEVAIAAMNEVIAADAAEMASAPKPVTY